MRVPFPRSAVLARAPGLNRRWGSAVAAIALAATSAAPAIALDTAGGFLQPAVSDAVRVSADAAPPTEPQSGWDPVTGLGTPNAANLIPDLVTAAH